MYNQASKPNTNDYVRDQIDPRNNGCGSDGMSFKLGEKYQREPDGHVRDIGK